MNKLGDLTYSKKEVYFLKVNAFISPEEFETVAKSISGISGVETCYKFNETTLAVIFFDGVLAEIKIYEIYQLLVGLRFNGGRYE